MSHQSADAPTPTADGSVDILIWFLTPRSQIIPWFVACISCEIPVSLTATCLLSQVRVLQVSVSCSEKDLIHVTTECVRGWSDIDVTDEKGSSPVIAAGTPSKPRHFAESSQPRAR